MNTMQHSAAAKSENTTGELGGATARRKECDNTSVAELNGH